MKILKENKGTINIFKDVPFCKMSADVAKKAKSNGTLDKNGKLAGTEEEVVESLNEGIYDDIEVGACFRIPNDPNRTVYEITYVGPGELKKNPGVQITVAKFGSHGHKFHTIYQCAYQELKDALAAQKLIICDEAHKQSLRQY